MLVHRHLSHLQRSPSRPRVVTVGAYDGVHRGHQEILRRLKACSRASRTPALVLSFEPLPREFFAPDRPAARLTRFRERYHLLANLGVDELFCPSFRRIRRLSAGEFIEDVLLAGLNARHVVVGEGFRFAANRLGTMDDLRSAGEARGFEVTEVPAIYWRGRRVSSTAIRKALREGDLALASDMLGKDYSISGRVVRGLGLGKDLGFPTANVNLHRRQAPVDGIFAARIGGLSDRLLDGVASVGTRPTVGGVEPLLEVFIFDFDQDIYGRYITVHFIRRLREERKYSDLAAMKVQMYKDVENARAALAA